MIARQRKSIYGFKYVFLASLAILAVHVYFLASLPYDLYADEAQYWSWSKNLDWGYYSKPPMVAWIIAATTRVCGDGEFCVRIGSPIIHFFTAILMYLIGSRLFTRRVGFWSSIIYSTLPGVTVSSYLISTDVPFLFFWALALYALIRALHDWHIKWWILLGLAIGFGMLSKYTMVLFLVSTGLYFLSTRENRVYLFSFKFWLALIIAGSVYWQNFAWNMAHDFASYNHTKDNAALNSISLHPGKMVEFISAQFGVFGPLLFAVLLFNMLFMIRILCKRDVYKLLFSFIIPFLVLITFLSLLSRAHANWAVPIYIPATVLVVSLITARTTLWVKFSLYLHVFLALVFYQFHNLTEMFDLHTKSSLDPFHRLKGQKQLAEMVRKEYLQHSGATLLTTDRKTHATLLYYLRDSKGNPPEIIKWNGDKRTDDHYDMTTDMNKQVGENFFMVTKPYDVSDITRTFTNSSQTSHISIQLYSDYKLEYDTYFLEGFQGY